MGRQVRERDRMAIAFGDLDASRQVLGDRIRERDFTLSDHVSEQESSEHLAYRAYLKTSVAIQVSRVTLVEMAVRNNPPALRSHYADDDADAIFWTGESVDPFDENFSNVSIRRENDHSRVLLGLSSCRGCGQAR